MIEFILKKIKRDPPKLKVKTGLGGSLCKISLILVDLKGIYIAFIIKNQ